MSDNLYLGMVAALAVFCALGVFVLLMWGVVSVCDAVRADRNRRAAFGLLHTPIRNDCDRHYNDGVLDAVNTTCKRRNRRVGSILPPYFLEALK